MSISSKGFWDGVEAENIHCHDPHLSQEIIKFFKGEQVKNVVDLGCGMGNYVKDFRTAGINTTGYDGNPKTPELSKNTCSVLDISVPIKFELPYDWVMSLEVGEHIPGEFEDIFIQNLHNNNVRGILLSWAIEGQGGYGHVNCRNNDYIKTKICKLGYTNDIEIENAMRSASSLLWFKNTIMVFRRV